MAKKKGKNSEYKPAAPDAGALPQKNPEFSMKKFLVSPEVVGQLLLWGVSFFILFAADRWTTGTVKTVLCFVAISLTFAVTDKLIELYNLKKYGVKPQSRGLFSEVKEYVENDSDHTKE